VEIRNLYSSRYPANIFVMCIMICLAGDKLLRTLDWNEANPGFHITHRQRITAIVDTALVVLYAFQFFRPRKDLMDAIQTERREESEDDRDDSV